jgi:hypothetical protein
MSAVTGVALFMLLALLFWPPWDLRSSVVSGGATSPLLPNVSSSPQNRVSVDNRPASSASPLALAPQRHAPTAPPRPTKSADERSTRLPGGNVARHRKDGTERMAPPALRHPGAEAKETAGKAEDRFVHPEVGYTITPPPGFLLTRLGARTVWHGPRGAQLLVETTATPGRSARGGWEELHAVLKRKYGARYRLREIADTRLAGRPAAVWDFELDTPVGTRRKRDVAVLAAGRGYGILVSAPVAGFDGFWPQFDAALRSFTLSR